MTTYTLPGDEKILPKVLTAGNKLIVNSGGTSHNEVLNGAEEDVNQGGTARDTTVNDGALLEVVQGNADHTTVNEGGVEDVQFGTINNTTINGGSVQLHHATADHTTLNFSLNFPTSEVDAFDHSVVKNTVITGGTFLITGATQHGLLVDATSTAENVEFRAPNDPNAKNPGGAGLGLENPQNLTGFIKGLNVGDFLQFGGLSVHSPSIDVTSFQVTKNNDLIITYNDATHTGLHATYHLQAMQAHTTFSLNEHETFPGGTNTFSTLTVVKTVGVADVHHDGHLLQV
jgi:autotransporter passenger strand-loop-strand repeat protein